MMGGEPTGGVVNIFAPGKWDFFDSYGLIACQLARHLTRRGVHVNAYGLHDTQCANQPPDVAAITGAPRRAAWGGVALGYPTNVWRHGIIAEHGPRVIVTMFESSRIPPTWVEPLNAYDAVIVPSTFCAEAFAASGVTAPTYVAPLGIGERYTPVERPTGRPLTFLAFMDRGRRKGGVYAIDAFLEAFGDATDVRLVLKARPNRRGTSVEFTNPNIDLIQRDMTEDELAALYAECDVLINANMGEGFGLIPREFAATGGVALATAWGGTADAIRNWGVGIAYSLIPADWAGVKSLAGFDLGVWALPDVAALARLMQDIAANRAAYQRAAMQRAPRVAAMYRWQSFADRVLQIWREINDGNGNRTVAGGHRRDIGVAAG